jgi:RNA polymerase sigma-70 factor (ECF subfamily)
MKEFGGRQFATTRWSVVLKAKEPGEEHGRLALEQLCQFYWQPLYSFVRRKGYDPQTSADLTQGFFTHLLENQILEKSSQHRGRFRSFLLACIQNFINNEHDRENAIKRGGGVCQISLNVDAAESKFSLLSKEPSPELVFDKEWAQALLARVHEKLDHSAGSHRVDLHNALKSFLTTDMNDGDYGKLTEQFGMTKVAARVAVFRLREKFRKLLRLEVAETLQESENVDEEITHLLGILTNG